MAQQINLLNPILLTPKKHFSALAMAQGLGVVILAGVLLGGWTSYQTRQSQRAFLESQQQLLAEQKSLLEALTGLPAPADPKVIEQQVQHLTQQNERQGDVLRALSGGLNREGERHSDLLKLLAASVPPPVWISEARFAQGRLELAGATLDTAVLRAWLDRLAAHPLLKGQKLSAVQVEKWAAEALPAGQQELLARAAPVPASLSATVPGWRFRVLSEAPRNAAALAASASAPASQSAMTVQQLTGLEPANPNRKP